MFQICNTEEGLRCLNSKQTHGFACLDYKSANFNFALKIALLIPMTVFIVLVFRYMLYFSRLLFPIFHLLFYLYLNVIIIKTEVSCFG